MSIMPEFQMGLCNAWIPVIYAVLITSVLPFLVSREAAKRMYDSFPLNKTEKIATIIDWLLLFAFIVYSFFIPFKLYSIWFYKGLSVILLGEIMVTASVLNFLTTPINKPIAKGIYKI